MYSWIWIPALFLIQAVLIAVPVRHWLPDWPAWHGVLVGFVSGLAITAILWLGVSLVPWPWYPVLLLLVLSFGIPSCYYWGIGGQLKSNVTWAMVPLIMLISLHCWAWLVTQESPDKLVTTYQWQPNEGADTLIVLVHGMGGADTIGEVAALVNGGADRANLDMPVGGGLQAKARPATRPDVLWLSYGEAPTTYISNARPEDVAEGITKRIHEKFDPARHQRVVLVGHSMGALLVRQAFLTERNKDIEWTKRVKRLVLLAGMNRGWSIAGDRPLDQGWGNYLELWVGTWLGQLSDSGRFGRNIESGTPFVANLRLEWLRLKGKFTMPHTLQLLGDIDELVSDADNTDLRVSGASGFCWLRVRGTGHGDIVKVAPSLDAPNFPTEEDKLRAYRREKINRAVTEPIDNLLRENEVLPYQTDPDVKHVVFVLHGIRDLGRWSADFERDLLDRYRTQLPQGSRDKLIIVSPRYGYYGMGPFLIKSNRQQYVRWFMDQYTETLARYPNAKQIDFFGHSNGTYVLTSALEDYESMTVNRVVFAGSVVRTDYDWSTLIATKRVEAVRNYKASDDWVVALFPHFFEQPHVSWLGNDLGGAGFYGFDDSKVENVGPITGQHSAFATHVDSIVEFILPPPVGLPKIPTSSDRCVVLDIASPACSVVWLLLAGLIMGLGFYVARGSQPHTLAVAIAYALIVVWLLRTI